MRVVVTGGAGFIGSELVRQLLDAAVDVTVVDNFVNGKRDNLSGLPVGRLSVERVDVREVDEMRRIVSGADALYHLACLGVRHAIHAPRENHDVNATATLDLLAICREAGVGRFVQVSTSEVYGTARVAPMSEQHPTAPTTVYGAAKLAGESYARAYFETYRYPTVVVRPFNAFGPRSHHEGDSGEVIPKFMLRCLAGLPVIIFGDGEQTRDFTYVADTARGIMMAGLERRAVGSTVNIGSGTELSINRLAREVAAVVGVGEPRIEHLERRPGEVRRLIADAALARELLAFVPSTSLRDGLARLRDWYGERGRTPVEMLAEESVRNWEPGRAPAPV